MIAEHTDNEIIAFVYLLKEGNRKNMCLVDSTTLILISGGKKKTFSLQEIRRLSFTHKLLLLPIVLGGSFGPFFFIALLSGHFPPIVSLLGFLASILFLYLGFSGRQALKVETLNDVHETFLSGVSENIRSFVDFVNAFIKKDPKENHQFTFYLPMSQNEKENLRTTGSWKLHADGIFGYDFQTFTDKKQKEPGFDPKRFLKIDLRKENIQVRYKKDNSGSLRPRFYGEISAPEE